jgi:YD repeat-containing protein
VNLNDVSYTRNWIDFELREESFRFRLERTYDSRSIESGLFGFGWCSNLDTAIEPQRDGRLLVKDCTPRALRNDLFERSPRDLKRGFGEAYRLASRPNERIERDLSSYTWYRDGGLRERFDLKGRLLERRFKAPFTLRLHYSREGHLDRLELNRDSGTRVLLWQVALDPQSGKIRRLSALQGRTSALADALVYEYDGEDLVRAHNAWNHAFHFAYDGLHNLTRIEYPDQTRETLTYDRDRDRLLSFRGRDGCIERYTQKEETLQSPKAGRHLIAEAVRSCEDQVQRRQRREFWIARSPAGTSYLARALIKDGSHIRDLVFDRSKKFERN